MRIALLADIHGNREAFDAVLEAIRRAFPSPRIRIADRGLREGILLQLMHADRIWSNPRGRRW